MNGIKTILIKLLTNTSTWLREKISAKSKYSIYFWIGGLLAFLWIILRSGTNPKRLAYPCQKASFPLASAWFIAVASILGGTVLWRLITKIGLVMVLIMFVGYFTLSSYYAPGQTASNAGGLPTWEVANPVSEIFVLDNIPLTSGSLNAGDASVPDAYLSDPAMDSLFMIMDSKNLNLYKTTSTPDGLVSSDETVIIKGNFQWKRTLSTNTDRIKGLIWRILQHPDGFTGEILVCENHQNSGDADLTLCNNSEDLNQTILDVINTFKAKGYPVDIVLWSDFTEVVVNEYSSGDFTDGYTWNSTTMVSYPKFTTPKGTYVSLKHGIWNTTSSTYDRENLCIVNFPVAKAHGWVGATLGIKNWLGTLTASHAERYSEGDIHCDYWFNERALPARVMAETFPDLTIIDATWTAPDNNYIWSTSNQIRTNTLIASTDPVAASYYGAKYVLNPIATDNRRTDPDNTDNSGTCADFNIPYSVVFSNWTDYLINTAGLSLTRDTLEMSVYSRNALTNTPVTFISVSSEGSASEITTLNGTLQLYANILPSNASNKTVTWTVNNSLATINQSGLLTAADDGDVIVTATANDGSNISGNITITLSNQNPVLVSSITISAAGSATAIDTDGGSLQLSTTVLPANATNSSITWSVDNDNIASVNQAGLLTAINNGTVTATATAKDGSGVSDDYVITISNQNLVAVTSISVSSEGDATEINTEDGTLQFYATILPANATDKSITWSVNIDTIANISTNGLVSALDDGSVIITATANDGSEITGNMAITISNQNPIPVSSISVVSEGNATGINIENGSLQLFANVLPTNAANQSVTWTLNNYSLASITQTGLLSALDDGIVTATATANDGSGISDDIAITLSNQNPIPVSSITLSTEGNATEISTTGGTLQIYASVLPINATDRTITWSVNNTSIAQIDQTGLLSAYEDGTVTITALANDGSEISSSLDIILSNQNPILVSSIKITSQGSANYISVEDGTLQLYANVLPVNATNESVTWSVNNTSVASITQTGLITALDDGVVVATATADDGSGISNNFEITVSNQNPIPVSSITVSSENDITEILTEGGTLQLYANVLPLDATDQTTTWSVNNNSLAGINQNGLLTAFDDGTVTATATANDGSWVSGVIDITISNQNPIPVSSISVSSEGNLTEITVENGSLQLYANVLPSDATNRNVTWSVNNPYYASIDQNGLLTATGTNDGEVTVFAKANDGSDVSGSIHISLSNQNPIPVSSISISSEGNNNEITTKGGTLQFSAQVLPENANDKSITWSVNNPSVAGIDQNGLLTAFNNGSVTIAATANDGSDVSGNMLIHVSNQNPIFVTEISITSEDDITEISTPDGSLQLYAHFLPENATNKTVTWSVDDKAIATVTPNGLLTGNQNGVVTISALANDGSGVFGRISITLSNQDYVAVKSVDIFTENNKTTIIEDDGQLQILNTVNPENATNDSIEYSLSDYSIASIDNFGLLTAKRNGITKVYASSIAQPEIMDSLLIEISNQIVSSLTNISDNYRVFPNPANNRIIVEQTQEGKIIYSLSNISGIEILSKETEDLIFEINTSYLKDGIYILRLSPQNQESQHMKIIIEH